MELLPLRKYVFGRTAEEASVLAELALLVVVSDGVAGDGLGEACGAFFCRLFRSYCLLRFFYAVLSVAYYDELPIRNEA